MRNTVRSRLTLWYTFVLAAVLVVFSIGVYSQLRNALTQRLDGNLRSATEVAALSLNHEVEEHGGQGPGEENVRFVLNSMYQQSFPRPNIAVWQGTRLAAEKTGVAALPSPAIRPAMDDEEADIHFSTYRGRQGNYRVAAASVWVPQIKMRYHVVSNESLQPVEAELATLREILFVTVPLCLLLAAGAGYFLARKSLAPVMEMTDMAEQIGSHSLDQRITIANPNDELGRLADTFNRLFERLHRAFRQQRQFMADASHELRTPLSVALTATEVTLVAPRAGARELRDTLDVVHSQLLRLRRVVEDMFMLAQADSESYRATLSTFYLEEVIVESARAARVLAQRRNITVSAGPLLSECAFEGDEGLLRQLLLILLDNAVKYTPPGGVVRASMKLADNGVHLLVSDNGPGIALEDQPHIFDRFYRADKARSRREPAAGGGAGLGLAIARWIAGLHHGTIHLENSSEFGSTFCVWLPLPDREIDELRRSRDYAGA